MNFFYGILIILSILILNPDFQALIKFTWQGNSKKKLAHARSIIDALSKNQSFDPSLSYKEFNSLWRQLLDWQRELGASIRESLIALRKILMIDLRSEEKRLQLSRQTLLQGLTIFGMEFLFGAFAAFNGLLKIEERTILMAILWQGLGFAVLNLSATCIARATFSDLDRYLAALLKLGVLTHSPLAITQILAHLDWDSFDSIKEGVIAQRVEELKHRLELWQKRGSGIKDWIQFELAEMHFLQEQFMEIYQQKLKVLSFFVLVCFFLSTFLYLVLKMSLQIV